MDQIESFNQFIITETRALGLDWNDTVCKLTYILELHHRKCIKSAYKYYELGFSNYWTEARIVDSDSAKKNYLKCINYAA